MYAEIIPINAASLGQLETTMMFVRDFWQIAQKSFSLSFLTATLKVWIITNLRPFSCIRVKNYFEWAIKDQRLELFKNTPLITKQKGVSMRGFGTWFKYLHSNWSKKFKLLALLVSRLRAKFLTSYLIFLESAVKTKKNVRNRIKSTAT